MVRDGKITNISIFELLVGDILQLRLGEICPVDGILVTGYKVQVDESQITGEMDLITKVPALRGSNLYSPRAGEPSCCLISGSKSIYYFKFYINYV